MKARFLFPALGLLLAWSAPATAKTAKLVVEEHHVRIVLPQPVWDLRVSVESSLKVVETYGGGVGCSVAFSGVVDSRYLKSVPDPRVRMWIDGAETDRDEIVWEGDHRGFHIEADGVDVVSRIRPGSVVRIQAEFSVLVAVAASVRETLFGLPSVNGDSDRVKRVTMSVSRQGPGTEGQTPVLEMTMNDVPLETAFSFRTRDRDRQPEVCIVLPETE